MKQIIEVTLVSCVIYEFHAEQLPGGSALVSVCVWAAYLSTPRADQV